MPGEERVVLHPPEDWLRRYVSIALPIVKRILAKSDEHGQAAQRQSQHDEQATA